MIACLFEVKGICNAIALSRSPLTPDDINLYTLNGLSGTYQTFKTSICTNLQPMNLDDFYALLYSEEINISDDVAKEKE